MIRNVILPEKIGSYYLFSKRIVGFDITRTHVIATQVLLKGSKISIEKCIEEKIETGINEPQEHIASAIKNITQQLSHYNEIRTAISSSVVIFKELRMPFTTREKIKMALAFEIDPLLPFSSHDAVIDFIITKEHKEEGSADILVAAVQKQYIINHLQLFESAGISPNVITVDLFALYGLYSQIPGYKQEINNTVLLDLGSLTTGIGYIKDHQLRYIRSIPKGISTIAKTISKELNLQPGQAIGQIIRYGIKKEDDPKYTTVLGDAIKQFWKEIQFTIHSFTDAKTEEKSPKIILLGMATDIEGLKNFLHDELSITCETFDISTLSEDPVISIKTKQPIKSTQIMSVSIALPLHETTSFNLRQAEFASINSSLLLKQLIVSITLLAVLFGSMIGVMFIQVHNLKSEAKHLEEETIQEIKARFPKIEDDEDRLDDVIESAKTQVQQQERLLSSFLHSPSSSVLRYLLELTTRLDPKSLGLTVDQIVITEDKIKFTARVRDYEALKILEYDLAQSPLFKYIEPQEDPNFTMEITLAQRKTHGTY